MTALRKLEAHSAYSLPVPVEALSQHVVALGKTRSGKSSKLRVIVEYLLALAEAPVCILDPKGDWWGLKSSADGRRSGFPLVIFGGEHADVPINEHAGAHVAELVATGNRSCLIDLSGFTVAGRTRFFIDYASTLFKLTKGKRYQIIDECHNFAPKGKIFDPEAGKALHWANRLASEGQGKGLILLAASQRPQKVHNDFLTSCETLIACRVIHKADRDAIKDWIDGCADVAAGKQVLADLAQMQRSDAWVWSPEIDFGPKRISFPLFTTYDSFKPQEVRDDPKLTGWAEVDLVDVKQRLQAVMIEHAANDPAELKKRVRELEKQIAAKPADAKPWITQEQFVEEVDSARRSAYEQGKSDGTKVGFQTGMCRAFTEIETLAERMTKELPAIDARPENPVRRVEPAARAARLPDPAPTVARARQIDGRASAGGEKLSKAERKILTALAQYPEGRTKTQVAVLCAYAVTGGGFNNALGALRSRGLIEGSGDRLTITDAGLTALGQYDPLPTGAALLEHWLPQLSKAERAALEVLAKVYPKAMAKEDLATIAGYEPSGGGFNNALGRLRTLELITRGAEIRASEDLFS